MKILIASISLVVLATSCDLYKNPDTEVRNGSNAIWHKERWNGHVYVRRGEHGGIAHDPDCPCHRKL